MIIIKNNNNNNYYYYYYKRAMLHQYLGDHKSAINDNNNCLGINPKEVLCLTNLAFSHWAVGYYY